MNPEPEDEQSPPEIRGGDRPDDYIPDPNEFDLAYLNTDDEDDE